MAERETVMVRSKEDLMRGLKMCASASCDGCPYEDIGCSPPLAYDALLVIEDLERQIQRNALALPKEQEPRVLEYSEIKNHPLVWLEDNDKEDVIPALFLQYNGWNAEFAVQAPDEWVDTIIRSSIVISVEGMYGITWRAWTSRPTEEQRKAVKWDG